MSKINRPGAASLLASLLLSLTSAAHALPPDDAEGASDADKLALWCEVHYASDTRQLSVQASPDPYQAATVDFDGRFRFRAVVLGQPSHIEHITLTVYELGVGDAPVIIHQARHQAPFHADPDLPSLTGWNHVYDKGLGRELRYGCALRAIVAGKVMP